MEPERKAMALTTLEGERTIDKRFRSMAKRIPDVVAAIVGDGPIQPHHRGQIMGRVDRELDLIFPTARGGPSLIEGDIQEMTNRGRSRAVKSFLGPVIRDIAKVDPELARAIRDA